MGNEVLRVELHCHTTASFDGMMSFDSLVRTAGRVGLDVVAITDHDTIEGAKELRARAKADSRSLEIIVGEERTLNDGSHLIGLFLEEAIQSDEPAEAIEEIERQGGLCLIPHPFRKRDGLLRDGLERLQLFRGKCAGFELFNAKGSAVDNARARDLMVTGLCPFGGTDAHYECDLGECMNLIPRARDVRESVRAMFERRAPFRILGKRQESGSGERSYAPLYHRFKRMVAIPKPLLPLAKQSYRVYRNLRYGVGRKDLTEIHSEEAPGEGRA